MQRVRLMHCMNMCLFILLCFVNVICHFITFCYNWFSKERLLIEHAKLKYKRIA